MIVSAGWDECCYAMLFCEFASRTKRLHITRGIYGHKFTVSSALVQRLLVIWRFSALLKKGKGKIGKHTILKSDALSRNKTVSIYSASDVKSFSARCELKK